MNTVKIGDELRDGLVQRCCSLSGIDFFIEMAHQLLTCIQATSGVETLKGNAIRGWLNVVENDHGSASQTSDLPSRWRETYRKKRTHRGARPRTCASEEACSRWLKRSSWPHFIRVAKVRCTLAIGVCMHRVVGPASHRTGQKMFTLLDLCVLSLRRTMLIFSVPILSDDPWKFLSVIRSENVALENAKAKNKSVEEKKAARKVLRNFKNKRQFQLSTMKSDAQTSLNCKSFEESKVKGHWPDLIHDRCCTKFDWGLQHEQNLIEQSTKCWSDC